jgi:hypothetical protein
MLRQQALVEIFDRVGEVGDDRQSLVRHFRKAAEHHDLLGAVGQMYGQNPRPQRRDQRRVTFQHAKIALEAGNVDLLDTAREQQFFRRDQFEMQRHDVQPLLRPAANARPKPMAPPINVIRATCCI